MTSLTKLADGWQRFRALHYPKRRKLYGTLGKQQDPKVLFITCADSRIEPSFIFQAEPGDLFISRNPGNIVPPYGALLGGASASLEYALTALPVEDVIVCGHSNCGAMKGLLRKGAMTGMPTVAAWLRYAEASLSMQRGAAQKGPLGKRIEMLAKQNALLQLDHLKTYPVVAGRLAAGRLRLHAWYYNIAGGEITCFDPDQLSFLPLSADRKPACSGTWRLRKESR